MGIVTQKWCEMRSAIGQFDVIFPSNKKKSRGKKKRRQERKIDGWIIIARGEEEWAICFFPRAFLFGALARAYKVHRHPSASRAFSYNEGNK